MLPAFRVVARSFFKRTILRIFGLFIVWVVLWIWLAWLFGIWQTSLLKDTVIIVMGVGFPLIFRSIGVKSGVEILAHIRRETLTLSTLFLFYLNLESLPLCGELVMQPIIFLLVVMIAYAQYYVKGQQAFRFFSSLLVLIGLCLLIWTTVQILNKWDALIWSDLLASLLLSVWLPFVMFPYLYAVTFYAATEVILKRFLWINEEMPLLARLGVFAGLHGSVRWAKELTGRYDNVARAATFRGALSEMRNFRHDVARRKQLEADRLADLEHFSGQEGTDETGAQLDRREFDGTKRAL